MIRKILCKLGLHDWYLVPDEDSYRQCNNCLKVEVALWKQNEGEK